MSKLGFNNASKKSDLKLRFDPTEYVQYLDGMDLTDQEAKEILMTLWDMMIQFVDLGFDMELNADSVSPEGAHPACGIESDKPKTLNLNDMGEHK